jgi:hypothetical protein
MLMMLPAGAVVPMLMVVMAAAAALVCQLTPDKRFSGRVNSAGNPGDKLNPRIRQQLPGAAADAAADKHVDTDAAQQARQGRVAVAAGVQGHFLCDFTIFGIKNSESPALSKVLENKIIFCCYGDFHSYAISLALCLRPLLGKNQCVYQIITL